MSEEFLNWTVASLISVPHFNSGVEYISCRIRVFDVASEKQAQDFNSHNLYLCTDRGYHAIHHKVCTSKLNDFPFHLIYLLLTIRASIGK